MKALECSQHFPIYNWSQIYLGLKVLMHRSTDVDSSPIRTFGSGELKTNIQTISIGQYSRYSNQIWHDCQKKVFNAVLLAP